MKNEYSPWQIGTGDANLDSPDGKWRFEYENVGEIAMGAPLGGSLYLCSLETEKRIDLDLHAAGPIVWAADSRQAVIPFWNRKRQQQLILLDVEASTMTVYESRFGVVVLESIEGSQVRLILHREKEGIIDLQEVPVERVIPFQ